MGVSYQTIEASGFRTGEYVGHTARGPVRIKRSKIGWHVYAIANDASPDAIGFVGWQRKTLKELDELFRRTIAAPAKKVTVSDIFANPRGWMK